MMVSKPGIDDHSILTEAEGVISWFIRRGNMLFGYIESSCGKEVYFDSSSLTLPECGDLSVGDRVRFEIIKIDLGDGACKVRKIGDEIRNCNRKLNV